MREEGVPGGWKRGEGVGGREERGGGWERREKRHRGYFYPMSSVKGKGSGGRNVQLFFTKRPTFLGQEQSVWNKLFCKQLPDKVLPRHPLIEQTFSSLF